MFGGMVGHWGGHPPHPSEGYMYMYLVLYSYDARKKPRMPCGGVKLIHHPYFIGTIGSI